MTEYNMAGLVEHPGHADQSVHGRRWSAYGDSDLSPSLAKQFLRSGHMGKMIANGVFFGGKGQGVTIYRGAAHGNVQSRRTYAAPTKSSLRRLGRVIKSRQMTIRKSTAARKGHSGPQFFKV